MFCLAQKIAPDSRDSCYSEKIRLNIHGKTLKDTVVLFRNFINGLEDKRVICSSKLPSEDIEKLIWDCKYISIFLAYQKKLNKFSILSFKMLSETNILAYYYLCDRKTGEAVEMTRFRIENRKIVGINVMPNIYDGFVPIDEYDNQLIDAID